MHIGLLIVYEINLTIIGLCMDAETYVKELLENHFGLKVEKIPAGETKTPDFLVQAENEEYLIEVKEKEAHPELEKAKEKAFQQEELFQVSESLKTKSVLQNVVRDGKRQIQAFVTNEATFRVLWIHCTGVGYDATVEQIITGLYGSETIVDFSSEDAFSGICYYFGHSQFFKFKDSLDAVLVSNVKSEVILCLNNLSPRYEQIKNSQLVLKMEKGVRDPVEEAKSGKAFLVDSEVDRGKPEEVLEFLKMKYKSEKLQVMKITHFEVHSIVPHKSTK